MPQCMFRVHGNENDATIAVLKFVQAVLKGKHLRRTHEAESCRDEENDEPRRVEVRFSGLD